MPSRPIARPKAPALLCSALARRWRRGILVYCGGGVLRGAAGAGSIVCPAGAAPGIRSFSPLSPCSPSWRAEPRAESTCVQFRELSRGHLVMKRTGKIPEKCGKGRKHSRIFPKASERFENFEIKYVYYLIEFYGSMYHNFDIKSNNQIIIMCS